MKKIIPLLALVLCLGLTACSVKAEPIANQDIPRYETGPSLLVASIVTTSNSLPIQFLGQVVTTDAASAEVIESEKPNPLSGFVAGLADKYPWVVTVCMIMGMLRAVAKPVASGVRGYIASSPSTSDDEWLAKFEASPLLKSVAWVLDYLTSIKIQPVAK